MLVVLLLGQNSELESDYIWVADQTGGGGGSGLQSRTSANAATASIANGASANIQITAAKTYALQKIQTSAAAWVTLYVSDAARTADASRNETTDPLPGAGVIAEVITLLMVQSKILHLELLVGMMSLLQPLMHI